MSTEQLKSADPAKSQFAEAATKRTKPYQYEEGVTIGQVQQEIEDRPFRNIWEPLLS